MAKGAEYILLMIVVTVAAYCSVTPLAERTANSLVDSADILENPGRNR